MPKPRAGARVWVLSTARMSPDVVCCRGKARVRPAAGRAERQALHAHGRLHDKLKLERGGGGCDVERTTRGNRQDVHQPHLTKLDLRDRTQAVITAYETGLVQPGDTTAT